MKPGMKPAQQFFKTRQLFNAMAVLEQSELRAALLLLPALFAKAVASAWSKLHPEARNSECVTADSHPTDQRAQLLKKSSTSSARITTHHHPRKF